MTDAHSDLDEQIAKLIAGELSPEQVRAVEEQARRWPAVWAYLQDLRAQDRLLAEYAASLEPRIDRLEEKVLEELENLPAPDRRRTPGRWRAITPGRAVAAVMFLFVSVSAAVLYSRYAGRQANALTVVDGAVMARTDAAAPWVRRQAGHRLSVGDDLRWEQATGVVSLGDGTSLTLNGPAELTLTGRTSESRFSVYLHRGVVTAKVAKAAPGAKPFEVASSLGVVRSLGTEFTVQVSDNVLIDRRMIMRGLLPIARRIMAVTVIAGAVQVQAGGEAVVINAGADGVLTGDGPLTGSEAQAVVQRLMLSSQITGPLKPFLQAHDEQLQKLFDAIAAGDLDNVRLHANTLSEIWQPVGWLAHAKFHPNGDRYRVHDFIRRAREKGSHAADLSEGEDDESHEGTRVFLDHADQLMAWMKKIDDPNWGYEIIHVAKQVEEYAEEIRDGGRMPELGLPYVEHCLPSFIAYCEWFKRLPWDDTEQSISAEELLVSIRRDIEVARREILYPENQDPPGFVERCARQVRRNAAALSARLTEDDGSASPRARVAGSLVEDSERLEDQVRDFVLRCAVLEEMSELAKQRLGLLDAVRDLPEQTREFARYCGGSELENINAATSQLQQLKTQHDGWIDRRAEYRTALRCAPEGTPPLGDALVNRLSNMLELCTRLSENPDTATEP